jgi:uncharacterized protein with LGFP repeats
MTATGDLRSVSMWRALLIVLAVCAGLLAPLASPPAPAAAATAADWDPGYIIDDRVFYDSNAMTASEVQSFLDGKVRSCASGGSCLKTYGQATTSIAADRYCSGYEGAAYQTAAQIIDSVARSCGISQRVLLVLLEKEQSLVTSRAPSAWNYTAAMGQGCPDFQACNPDYAGFFKQVYHAARQFEIYRLNPNSYGYRAGRENTILYNPNRSCGTRTVYIANQATAALYIYTPYTPNAAALNNMYGTGDGCSTYGNRNFWRMFTDWFGNPRSYSVLDGFASYYAARGGASGVIGAPVSYGIFVEQNGQGWYQRFSGGTIYGSYQGGTVFVPKGSALDEYNRLGGPQGSMGWPNGEVACAGGGRCSQSFVSAIMSTTPAYGSHALWGGMRDHWLARGGTSGSLGPALNDMVYSQPSAGVAWVQNFEAGVLVQSAAGFVLVPYGAVQSLWTSSGAGSGALGWPTAGRQCDGGSCQQRFTGGIVTETAAFGAHAITGTFAKEWDARGGASGLGAAFNAEAEGGGGSVQNFAAGILARSSAGTYLVPYGPVQAAWSGSQAQRGPYRWPTSAAQCEGAACVQSFQGAILSGSSWGVYSTFGSLAAVWKDRGGIETFGVAINPIRYGSTSGGAWIQHYTKGVLTQQSSGQPLFTPYGPILNMWYHYGAETTWLGWPTAAPVCDANGCVQQFQNGVARANGGGVSFSRS